MKSTMVVVVIMSGLPAEMVSIVFPLSYDQNDYYWMRRAVIEAVRA